MARARGPGRLGAGGCPAALCRRRRRIRKSSNRRCRKGRGFRLSGSRIRARAPSTDDWLKSFNDPGLDAIVAEAIANNLDLRQAAAVVEMARQTVVVVGSKLWPQIGAQFGAATLHDASESANTNSNMQYGGISWEIDLWGRIRAQKAAAEAGFEATALDYAFARQSLAATTAKSWYLAIETRQLVALAEQAVEIYTRLLELVKIRRAAGKVADLDVAEASANLPRARERAPCRSGPLQRGAPGARIAARALSRSGDRNQRGLRAAAAAGGGRGSPARCWSAGPISWRPSARSWPRFGPKKPQSWRCCRPISLNFEGGRLSDRILDLVASQSSALSRRNWNERADLHRRRANRADQDRHGAGRANRRPVRLGRSARVRRGGGRVDERGAAGSSGSSSISVPSTTAHGACKLPPSRDTTPARIDLLSVLILQSEQLATQGDVIKLRNAQLANRINLHLALGGSFDAAPAANP